MDEHPLSEPADQSDPDPAHHHNPPTSQDPDAVEPAKPAWPTAFGVVSLVFASLSILGSLFSIIGAAIAPFISDFTTAQTGTQTTNQPANQTQPQQASADYIQITNEVSADFMVPNIALGSFNLILAGILAAAAITALMRKPATRTLHLAWVPLELIAFVASTVIAILMTQEIDARATAQAASPPFPMAELSSVIGIAFNAVWSIPYPLVLIWWFSRSKTKDDISNF